MAKYFKKEEDLDYFKIIDFDNLKEWMVNPESITDENIEKIETYDNVGRYKLSNLRICGNPFSFGNTFNTGYELTFKNCYFEGMVYFDDVSIPQDLKFDECWFDDQIIFSKNSFGDLDIVQCHFKQDVHFSGGKFNNIRFSQYDLPELHICGSEFESFEIGQWTGGKELKKLTIIKNNLKSGAIKVTGVDAIDEIFMHGINHSNILIENISCRKFVLDNFSNYAEFKVVGFKAKADEEGSHFGIGKSELGKAVFYRLDLKSFTEVNIHDSNLMQSSFINSVWPKKIFAFKNAKIGPSDKRKNDLDKKTKEFRSQQIETYRQLKYILSKQGDKIQEQNFYTLEMNLHSKQLSLINPFIREFWDKLILLFSRLFSNYGTNFGKALFWFLLLNFAVFASLIHFFDYSDIYFSCEHHNSKAFWKAMKLFVHHLNPFHKLDDTLTGGAVLLDFSGRIFSSYLIYHIIRTSRRFVK